MIKISIYELKLIIVSLKSYDTHSVDCFITNLLYDINKLDINRIYRYLDKYTNKDSRVGGDDKIIDDYVEGDIQETYSSNEDF